MGNQVEGDGEVMVKLKEVDVEVEEGEVEVEEIKLKLRLTDVSNTPRTDSCSSRRSSGPQLLPPNVLMGWPG